ncbi:MAG: transcription-repair coupling factor [Alphaproteobacteria bacterium]|nr:transcription-repair coupling factor [Alphaproteobacteria bacterium]
MSQLTKQLSFLFPAAIGPWIQEIIKHTQKIWCVFQNEQDMHAAKISINAFNPNVKILTYPQWDTLPYAAASPSIGVQMQRQSVLDSIRSTVTPLVILSTINAVIQKVGSDTQQSSDIRIDTALPLDAEKLTHDLSAAGFARVDTVYQSGEFSVRGSVIDIFPSGHDLPYRIDSFGDEIESIHPFDPATQRRHKDVSLKQLVINTHQEILLPPERISTFKTNFVEYFGIEGRGNFYSSIVDQTPVQGWEQLYPLFFKSTQSLFELFPNVTFLLPQKSLFSEYFNDLNESYSYRKQLWDNTRSKDQLLPPIQPDLMYCTDFESNILRQSNTHIYSPYKQQDGLDYKIRPLDPLTAESVTDRFNQAIKMSQSSNVKLVCALAEDQEIRYVQATHSTANERTLPVCKTWADVLATDMPVVIWQQRLIHGFKLPHHHIVTSLEVFGERSAPSKKRRAVVNAEDIIAQATALNVGDLIVHRQHGIGRYLGLETIEVFTVTHDCLALEYSGQDKLFLPVENIELLSRYGSDQGSAHLDKLGGTSWQSRQLSVKKQLRDIAKYLMNIAAKRMLKTAPAIQVNDGAFEEFCRRFTFVETDDQERAIQDVVTDLSKGTPMDRLICGDVGFGKTEVALRAAFLAVQNGYQVGIVAPTTILARQHYHTFKKRFEGLGYRIEHISRLVSQSLVTKTKQATADGEVSILIGTHALLSDSVKFKNLGLLIVDEEQVFGVKQKEKIKELSSNIHVLTLSATPIPRTLQMSLLGIKEMSLIATPPVDRRAIQTTLCEEDPIVMHQAIKHEIDRGGQVFYVCPRITDLDTAYTSLKKAFPDLSIVVAHGQLKPTEIEERLMSFIEGKAHILLSTQIIESGIDIPNANTMIIYNAQLFGLAQLYQLRGRIGRSTRQAYAYLITPQGRMLKSTAVKRLQVMSTLDALGAGFTLASHDLDIRGAGNLLGEEQSGHIKDVGVELYQDMLKQAVNTLKKKGSIENDEEDLWSPILSLGLSVGLPEAYIQDIETRMEIYRRLGALTNNDQVNDIKAELLDRFGRLPLEAENLIATIKIKILCRTANIQKAESGPNGVLFTFRNNQCGYVDNLLKLVQQNTAYKLRPDLKLFYHWSFDDIPTRVRTVKMICKDLCKLTTTQSNVN